MNWEAEPRAALAQAILPLRSPADFWVPREGVLIFQSNFIPTAAPSGEAFSTLTPLQLRKLSWHGFQWENAQDFSSENYRV